MELSRILGDNIKMLLKKKGVADEEFAEALGYSPFDVKKLCDARLLTTEKDVSDIASFFEVEPDYLFHYQSNEDYSGLGFMNCMRQFKCPNNKEKILDILDMYCDLKEAVES